MVLTFTNGAITTDGTEQDLWDITSENYFAGWIFVDALTSSEILEIKVYVLDDQDSTMRLYDTFILAGVQDDPAKFIPFIATKQYKVTVDMTAGSNREISWQRIEA